MPFGKALTATHAIAAGMLPVMPCNGGTIGTWEYTLTANWGTAQPQTCPGAGSSLSDIKAIATGC